MAIEVRKTKAGKSRYRVLVSDETGRYYPTKTFGTIRDAQFYERDLLGRKAKKEDAISALKRKIEVHNYFNEWFDSRSHKISEDWHSACERLSRTYILPTLGRMKLSDIRSPHIGRIMSEMKDLKLSDQTMLHVFNILNKSFKDAVEYFGYLEKNPVLTQDRPKVYLVEKEYLSPKESWKLLEYCKDHYLGPAIWICALTALRTSEIQALKWENVDFEKSQILVCAAFKRGKRKIDPYPKQRDWLIVPIPQVLLEYLKDRKGRFPLGFVAPAYMGGMLDHNKLYRGLRKMCDEANVKRVSPHGLRHSCTEIWIRKGATLEDIRRLLGHKSVETTRRYIHRTDERLIELAKEIRSQL